MTPEDGSNVYPIDVRSTDGRQHLTAVGSSLLQPLNAETLATDIMISYVRRAARALGLSWDEQNDEEMRLFVQCVIEVASARSAALLDSVLIDVRKLLDAQPAGGSVSDLRERT
jgi:hypothetical protein